MRNDDNVIIKYVQNSDKSFWFTLDRHLSDIEFEKKVRDRQGYIILQNNVPIGILRYNLFWDNTPFCNLLFIKEDYQRKGFGKRLMAYWENEMKAFGYALALVSTRSDEEAQYFYRSIGYEDCGSLVLPDQPEELFLRKHLDVLYKD